MARALSTATLSLGLVAIPVALHATRRREGRISYHLVHADCGSRVKRQYVCEEEGIPLEEGDLARAYESDEGEEVVMSAQEARAALPKATGRIDLIEFVPLDTLDAVHFDNAYYLAPGKGGDRAYHLLAETLREQGLIGVGTQLARGKSYLVALRATELGLAMHTLHHAEEVHPEDAVPHGEAGKITAAERELARSLVEQLRRPTFDARRFEDLADIELRAAIEAHEKKGGKKEKPAPHAGTARDLLATLKASLEAAPAPPARTAAKDGHAPAKRVSSRVKRAPARTTRTSRPARGAHAGARRTRGTRAAGAAARRSSGSRTRTPARGRRPAARDR